MKSGHPVLFSSRHPESLKTLVDELGPLARAGTVAEAIAFSDVLFLATPYNALPQLGQDHPGAWKGKVVLDATNAFGPAGWRRCRRGTAQRHRHHHGQIPGRRARRTRVQFHGSGQLRPRTPPPGRRAWPCRLPATTRRRCTWRSSSCAMRGLNRCWWAHLPARTNSRPAGRCSGRSAAWRKCAGR
ncbi:NADPH-dependent F420 reductase [Cupriavidus basilensis]